MTCYVAGYDTDAIYPWWEIGDRPYSASIYREMVSYEGARLDECLDGVRAVAEVHLRYQAPATFFIVAQLAEVAGARLREILDHELFDLESSARRARNFPLTTRAKPVHPTSERISTMAK